jgi:hypothetical protein
MTAEKKALLRRRKLRAARDGKRKGAAPARSKLARLLVVRPKPLIHPAARMILVFSAKSASTNSVIWFLNQLGHAPAAADYNPWPHRYRNEVYYLSKLYRDALGMDLTGFSLVRIVRDPFERAASSFRHALMVGYADGEMARMLGCGKPAVTARGYSFSEFIGMLEQSDLNTCNPHYRLQRHPIEDAIPVRHLINITTQDLYQRLNEVEADLGLPRTDFGKLDWLEQTSSAIKAQRSASENAYRERLTRQAARLGPWPTTRALLTPEARARLAKLYAVDISSYLQAGAALRPAASAG